MFAIPDQPTKPARVNDESKSLTQAKQWLDAMETANEKELVALQKGLQELVGIELIAAKEKLGVEGGKAESQAHFQTIIDIVQESLRRGYPQSWMY